MKRSNVPSLLVKKLLLFLALNVSSIAGANEHAVDSRTPKNHIQGRIADGRYYGAGDLFSIVLPAKLNTAEIEDFYAAPNVGGVAFFNQSGFLLKLEIDELIPEIIYLITGHPEIKHEILDALFYEVLMPQLKGTVPTMKVLHEEKITFASGEEALFAVLDLPESATLVDRQTGRNLDSKRGYLLFFSEGNKDLININMQDTLTLIPNIAEAAKARLNDRLLNHLIQYHSTFRIEPTILAVPKAL